MDSPINEYEASSEAYSENDGRDSEGEMSDPIHPPLDNVYALVV